jgi:hypothetical protein
MNIIMDMDMNTNKNTNNSLEQDSQNHSARTGQPKQNNQDRGQQTRQTEHDCQHHTVRTVLLGEDIRAGQPEQHS